ncbi:rod shape-determining protein MreC [Candidatus Pelagibacter sp. HIMB1623]|uniref:rod shape-determining protein MreC n=1 Tax=Candidatus Pelagibacter sp. HIMB1623 TaxID=3413358 RepID=UPI003F85DDAB
MALGRDEFVTALRSAFFKKKDKQKFSLITLIFLSILILILSNLNFKLIQDIRIGINEVIYRSTYFVSIPENKLGELKIKLSEHLTLYDDYKSIKKELEDLKQNKLSADYLKQENEKLRSLINENVSSNEILAKVIIDKDSPFLKSVILNRGSKDNVKLGMAIIDNSFLVGQIIEVNFTNSRALLLSDLNSKIPVIVQPPSIQAVSSGTGKDYGIIEFTKDDIKYDLSEQDRIIYTSGLGGMFKSGIPIGRIYKDSGNKIIFFSDFSQLDYVKIVKFNLGKN